MSLVVGEVSSSSGLMQQETEGKRKREEHFEELTNTKRIRPSSSSQWTITEQKTNEQGVCQITLSDYKPYTKSKPQIPHERIGQYPAQEDVENSLLINFPCDVVDSQGNLILGYRNGLSFDEINFQSMMELPRATASRGSAAGPYKDLTQRDPETPWYKKPNGKKVTLARTNREGNLHFSTKFGGAPSSYPANPINRAEKKDRQEKGTKAHAEVQAREKLKPLCVKVSTLFREHWPAIYEKQRNQIEKFNARAMLYPEEKQAWFENHLSLSEASAFSAAACNLHEIDRGGSVKKDSQAAYHFDTIGAHDQDSYDAIVYRKEHCLGGQLHFDELGIVIDAANDSLVIFRGTLFSHGVTAIQPDNSMNTARRFSCVFMSESVPEVPPQSSLRRAISLNESLPDPSIISSEVAAVEIVKQPNTKKTIIETLNPEEPLKQYHPFVATYKTVELAFSILNPPSVNLEEYSTNLLNVIVHKIGESDTFCNIKDFADQGKLKVTATLVQNMMKATLKFTTTRATSTEKAYYSFYLGNHRLIDRAVTFSTKSKNLQGNSYQEIYQKIVQEKVLGKQLALLAPDDYKQSVSRGYPTLQDYVRSRKLTEIETVA